MAKVWNSQEEFDAEMDKDRVECLTDDLVCKRCGAGAHSIRVVRLPNPNSWWNRVGKAKCLECGAEFGIELGEIE